jgi:ribosomal protein S18 acetylase RimI-like enzyme
MTHDMRIRTAVLLDLEAVQALVHRAYRGDTAKQGWTHEADLLDGQRVDQKMLAEMFVRPKQHQLLVAVEQNALIGCVHVSRTDGTTAYLGLLTVAPERQGSGLAKRLLLAAEQLAEKDFGASSIEMTVIRQRVELIEYYQRRGYHLTGEQRPFPYGDERFGVPRQSDLDFVVLEKTLRQL